MKKKVIIIISSFILLMIVIINSNYYHNDVLIKDKELSKKIYSSSISMMYETSVGSGEYVESKESTWPQDGYTFNERLSTCENGSTLSYNEETKKVIMTGNVSDKCYVYFDIYDAPSTIAEACKGQNMASCIKTNYELNSSILHHTTTLANSAGDDSYRYTGGNYIPTSKASLYDTVDDVSATANGLIKFYCGNDSYVGYSCIKPVEKYYYLATDNDIHYPSYEEALQAGIDKGLIEEINNYVCFGSTASLCPDTNLYRIIGVFGDKVKLIKADYAGEIELGKAPNSTWTGHNISEDYKGKLTALPLYYWSGSSDNKSNIWSNSTFNTAVLNGTYLTKLGDWAKMIATSTWKVGGNIYANIREQNAPTAYQNEIVSPAENTTYSAKIGLMYVSDYMYGATPKHWTKIGLNNCVTGETTYCSATSDNWMDLGGNYEWTITRANDGGSGGHIVCSGVSGGNVNSSSCIRSCFYLESSVKLAGGSGAESDPYRIKL